MQMRIDAQQPSAQSSAQPAPARGPSSSPAAARAAVSERQETSLDGLMLMFPGLVERVTAEGAPGG